MIIIKSQKSIFQGITMNVQNYQPEPPGTAENTTLRSPHLLIALHAAAVSKMRWQNASFIYIFFLQLYLHTLAYCDFVNSGNDKLATFGHLSLRIWHP